jgi:hypothetical protein
VTEALRQVAVIGQNKKPLGLGVEPADVEKAGQMGRQKIEDGVPRIWVGARRNKTSGLVQDDVEPALPVHEFPVDLDVIPLSRLRAEVRADAAIDRDPARGNQFIAMPPRAQTGCSEKAVEAHKRA